MEEELKETSKKYEELRKLRMTNWEDLDINQKIERMREVVKEIQRTTKWLRKDVEKIRMGFEKHSHQEGKIMVEYSRYYGEGEEACSEARATNYF